MDFYNVESEFIDSLDYLSPPVKRIQNSREVFGRYNNESIQLYREYRNQCTKISHNHLRSKRGVKKSAVESSTSLILRKTSEREILERYSAVSLSTLQTSHQYLPVKFNPPESKCKPLIKVTVIPKSTDPVQTAKLITRKRRRLPKRVDSTLSNHENSVETTNLYLVVAGRRRDKIYEIKTTGSATFSTDETESNAPNEAIKSVKNLIQSLDMNLGKKKEKDIKSLFAPHEIGTNLSEAQDITSPNVSVSKKGNKSRVRIYGQLGLTDDDRYVLRYGATVNDKPVSEYAQMANPNFLPERILGRSESYDSSVSKQEVKKDISIQAYPAGEVGMQTQVFHGEAPDCNPLVNKDVDKYSHATQVNFNINMSCGRRLPYVTSDKDTQCICEENIVNFERTFNKQERKSPELGPKDCGSPLVIISVYPKPSPEDVFKSDKTSRNGCLSSPIRSYGIHSAFTSQKIERTQEKKMCNFETEYPSKENKSSDKKKDSKEVRSARSPSPKKKNSALNLLDKPIETRVLTTHVDKKLPDRYKAIRVIKNKILEKDKCNPGSSKIASYNNNNTKGNKNHASSRRSPTMRSKERGTNTDQVVSKKGLVDSYAKQSEQWSPKDSIPAKLETSKFTNAEAEVEYYNSQFEQERLNTDLKVMKQTKDIGSQRSDVKLSGSLENFLEYPEKEPEAHTSMTLYCNKQYDKSPAERASGITIRDSLEISHRREDKNYTNVKNTQTSNTDYSDEGIKYDTEFLECTSEVVRLEPSQDMMVESRGNRGKPSNSKAPIKHYTGDDCSIIDPVERDKQIRELLGVDNSKLFLPKNPTAKAHSSEKDDFPYHCFYRKECMKSQVAEFNLVELCKCLSGNRKQAMYSAKKAYDTDDSSQFNAEPSFCCCLKDANILEPESPTCDGQADTYPVCPEYTLSPTACSEQKYTLPAGQMYARAACAEQSFSYPACTKQKFTLQASSTQTCPSPDNADLQKHSYPGCTEHNYTHSPSAEQKYTHPAFTEEMFAYPVCTEQKYNYPACTEQIYNQSICARNKNIQSNCPNQKCLYTASTKYLHPEENYTHSACADQKFTQMASVEHNFAHRMRGEQLPAQRVATHRSKLPRHMVPCCEKSSPANSEHKNASDTACAAEENEQYIETSCSSVNEENSQPDGSLGDERPSKPTFAAHKPVSVLHNPTSCTRKPVSNVTYKPNYGICNPISGACKPMPGVCRTGVSCRNAPGGCRGASGLSMPNSVMSKPAFGLYMPSGKSTVGISCQSESLCRCPSCRPNEPNRMTFEGLPSEKRHDFDPFKMDSDNPDCPDVPCQIQDKQKQSIYQQLILNRNIQVFLQVEQFSKQRPIILSRKQYKKVKETIQNTICKKNSREIRKKLAEASEVSVGEVRRRRNTQLCQRSDQEIQTEIQPCNKSNCRRINRKNRTITKVRHHGAPKSKRIKISGDELKYKNYLKKIENDEINTYRHPSRLQLNTRGEYYVPSTAKYAGKTCDKRCRGLDNHYKRTYTRDYRVLSKDFDPIERHHRKDVCRKPEKSLEETPEIKRRRHRYRPKLPEDYGRQCLKGTNCSSAEKIDNSNEEVAKVATFEQGEQENFKNEPSPKRELLQSHVASECRKRYKNIERIRRPLDDSYRIHKERERRLSGDRERIDDCRKDMAGKGLIDSYKTSQYQNQNEVYSRSGKETQKLSEDPPRPIYREKVSTENQRVSEQRKDREFQRRNREQQLDCEEHPKQSAEPHRKCRDPKVYEEIRSIIKDHTFERTNETPNCGDLSPDRQIISEDHLKINTDQKKVNLGSLHLEHESDSEICRDYEINYEESQRKESQKKCSENIRKIATECPKKSGEEQRISKERQTETMDLQRSGERHKNIVFQGKTREQNRNSIEHDGERQIVSVERRERDKMCGENPKKKSENLRKHVEISERKDRERLSEERRDRERVNEERRDRERLSEERRDRERVNEERRDRERVNEERRDREIVNEDCKDRDRASEDRRDRSTASGERKDRERVSSERRDREKGNIEIVKRIRQRDGVAIEQRRVSDGQNPYGELLRKSRDHQKACGGDPKKVSKEREKVTEERQNINEEHKGREKVTIEAKKRRSKERQMESRDAKTADDRQSYDEKRRGSRDRQRTSGRHIKVSSERASEDLSVVEQPELNIDENEANKMKPDVIEIESETSKRKDKDEIPLNDIEIHKDTERRRIKPKVEVMMLETESNSLAPKTASSLEIHYSSVAYLKHIDLSSSDVAVLSDSSVGHVHSFHTIFRGHQKEKSPTPNLGTSVYSIYTNDGFVSDKSAEYIMAPRNGKTNKKPFLMRLMSCLVMRSTRASALKLPATPVKDFPSVNTSVDSYHISTSLGAVEVSSSVYDTTASFYSNHTIMPINSKMKRGFINSVRGFLTNRKS